MKTYKTCKVDAYNSDYYRADAGGESIEAQVKTIADDQMRLNKLADTLEEYLNQKKVNNNPDMANFYQEFPIIEAFVKQEIFENGKYYRINTRSAVALAKFFFMAGIKWHSERKSLMNILKWK